MLRFDRAALIGSLLVRLKYNKKPVFVTGNRGAGGVLLGCWMPVIVSGRRRV